MSDVSSADPQKLLSYSESGLAWADGFLLKVQRLANAIEAYNAGPGIHPRISPDVAEPIKALAEKYRHLDDFVGDVGRAFNNVIGLDEGRLGRTGVWTFHNDTLARNGQIGYANRDQAIREAERLAEDLKELAANGQDTSRDEIEAMIADISRGQHDPAFAVTFSNELGIDGYADATALIRMHYWDPEAADDPGMDGVISQDGLDAVAVLATTMTTALNSPGLERRFKDQLVGGYRPEGRGDDHEPTEADLSVLLGMTDPPADIAVEIANNRMSPWLQTSEPNADAPLNGGYGMWGDNGSIVTNYSQMLSRKPDASALWLDSRPDGNHNLELVLGRDAWGDTDGGQALAQIVENGLTNDNPDLTDRHPPPAARRRSTTASCATPSRSSPTSARSATNTSTTLWPPVSTTTWT